MVIISNIALIPSLGVKLEGQRLLAECLLRFYAVSLEEGTGTKGL